LNDDLSRLIFIDNKKATDESELFHNNLMVISLSSCSFDANVH